MKNKFKKTMAVLASATMVLSTSSFLPYNNFNHVGRITANAEESHHYDSNGFCTNSDCTDIYQPAEDTDGDTYYEIGNAGQLYWFASQFNNSGNSLNAVLTTDIFVNEGVMSAETTGAREWTPIGNYYKQYTATFDGQNHAISGLYFNDGNADSGVGFFGSIGNNGKIKNVGIINSYIKGYRNVGGVCGYVMSSTGYNDTSITNCYNTSTVICTQSTVGGICGNTTEMISDCYNTGAIYGYDYAGGICGFAYGAEITNCYNTGAIKIDTSGGISGGIVGEARNGSISNCYANGYVGLTSSVSTNNLKRKTNEEFASGEIAYLLNGSQSSNVRWYQKLGNDTSPVLNGEDIVYYHNESCISDKKVYTNKESEHTFTYVNKNDSACTDDGNVAHLYCTDCQKSFNPEDGKTEITDTVIKASHVLMNTKEINATCTDDGNIEYWQCLKCGKSFSDEACKTEVKFSDTIIKAGHKLTHTAGINATCTDDGNIEYWYCSECDKYFSDEACKSETTPDKTVIEAKGHNVKEIKKLEPTCTEDGHNDYAYCPDCETYFSGKYNLNPTLPEYQIIDKLGHDFGEKYEYDKKSHWKTCSRCKEVKKEEHTFTGGKCSVCGLSESYVNAPFTVSGNMNFYYSESSGNWKKDATLTNDGYAWNEDTKTLTLGNIYINGDLILPYDNGLNTIVIADGANPIVSGKITFAPYQTSLTVKGNGTLTAGFDNGNVGSDNLLTITGGAEVITDFMIWSTNGGIAISDGGKLNVSEYIFTEKITMDKTAKFEIDSNVGISCYGYVENGFAGLEKYVPSGYIMKTIDDSTFIIPKDASLIFDDEALKYNLVDKNGNSITGRVTLRYNPYSDGIGEHLAGHSISLDGNIGVNFYMELDESVIEDKDAYMQFTLPNGKISKVNVSGAKTDTIDGKLYYVFSCEVAAKEMFDTIKAQIISGDKEGTVYKYSVKDYADYISDHSGYDKKTVNLVDAMLKYGEYAKSYFSKEETTDISDVEADELAKYEKQTTGNLPDGITYYGSSLLLESNTTVRHYFKVTKGTDVSGYGFKDKNGYYYTEITGISAAKLSTPQTTTIGNWNISYSPMSYVYSVLKSDSADENLVNLCKALYLYQQTATEYQNK
ncbi:MAG: hypothetical protein K2K89_11580 [Ruminococcus sp.]|nr:hypothetical protein [Ruminococcus sp.]